jgi:hypothetical protein
MNDCWDCIHLEKRCGGFQYCIRYGRRNVDANIARCRDYQVELLITNPTQPLPTQQSINRAER